MTHFLPLLFTTFYSLQIGVVVALSMSAHAHGLKHMRLPMAAAFVPGLPTPFAVVFYFLLETRQMQRGGTLLPLHAATETAIES